MTRDSPYPYLPCAELVLVAASVMFVVGSVFFLPGWYIRSGDILFILGSFIYLGKSVVSMRELCGEHGSKVLKVGELGADFFENVCYFLACIVFTLGCILWWPGIYPDEESMLVGKIIASWCFILGSLGFVIASFCNAMLLSKSKVFKLIPGRSGQTVYTLAFTSLLFSQLGGVFFTTGSYMYRPGFNNHCERHIRKGWAEIASIDNLGDVDALVARLSAELNISKERAEELMPSTDWCIDIEAYGTYLYIVGSFCYLAQALLYYFIAILKERADRKYGKKADGDDSDSDSDSDSEDDGEKSPISPFSPGPLQGDMRQFN